MDTTPHFLDSAVWPFVTLGFGFSIFPLPGASLGSLINGRLPPDSCFKVQLLTIPHSSADPENGCTWQMNVPPAAPDAATAPEPSREDRIRQVLDQVLVRREAGASVSDADVIADYRELLPELAERLQFLALIHAAEATLENGLRLPAASLVGQPIQATLRPDLDDWEADPRIDAENEPVHDAQPPQNVEGDPADAAVNGGSDIRMTTILPARGSPSGPPGWTDTHPACIPVPEFAPETTSEARLWRPFNRPPAAVLAVLDDYRDAAEFLRLRGDVYRIGRDHGDLLIPHDSEIAAVHCEISREEGGGRWRWFLTDLSEDQGVFVKVNECALKHGDEIIVGTHRLRFESVSELEPDPSKKYRIVGAGRNATSFSVELRAQFTWIGSDPGFCGAFTLDDSYVDPRHALLRLDARARWCIKDANSVNGVWVRIQRVRLRSGCSFRCGEQLFRFFAP